MHLHTYIHTHTHIYTNTYIYKHTHIHNTYTYYAYKHMPLFFKVYIDFVNNLTSLFHQ